MLFEGPLLFGRTYPRGKHPYTSYIILGHQYTRMNYNHGSHSSSFNYGMGGPYVLSLGIHFSFDPFNQQNFPFLAHFDLSNLDKLMNDPICHNVQWQCMLNNISSSISKFEGKLGENPSTHNTTYHLWCSSNSFVDDYMRLRNFQEP